MKDRVASGCRRGPIAARGKAILESRRHGDDECSRWRSDVELGRQLIAQWIVKAIDKKWGTAVAAERATAISKTEFSRIRNGNLSRYSVDRLVQLLDALDKDAEVRLILTIRRRSGGITP
jgi:predicted XRE-type DNA-binding protein